MTLVTKKGKKKDQSLDIIDIDAVNKNIVNTKNIAYDDKVKFVRYPYKTALVKVTSFQVIVNQIVDGNTTKQSIIDVPADAQEEMKKISEIVNLQLVSDSGFNENGTIGQYTLYQDGNNLVFEVNDLKTGSSKLFNLSLTDESMTVMPINTSEEKNSKHGYFHKRWQAYGCY